ncbi:MAG: OmpA family protein [Planctomycetes bacterium]|nr:OmpA family protein [Planctomycetota bacterium]MBU1517504.1 OmpA family protein [Planctomycetota bacterium]MBU2457350.1 OmpA family protein [Planctomycetota bacterium]MBU2596921.1 OmpA family protein [Planctomycetota bacterium]
MQAKNLTCLVVISLIAALLASGCTSQEKYDDLKLRNQSQQQRIDDLESQYNVAKLKLVQTEKHLADAKASCVADVNALSKKIEAMRSDIGKKEELIKKMQAALGGAVLPPELASELAKFAAENSDMITFDEASGMVKFKSDLLFEKGSDVVAPSAAELMKRLCVIINSSTAEGFDITIVGHTDDIPIRKSQTMVMHPTNWHLSVHRAISVENLMESNGVNPARISVKGYGEYRPLEANEAGKKGNPKNRRVEIYLVPAGK